MFGSASPAVPALKANPFAALSVSGFGNALSTQGSTRSAPQFATLASSVPVSRFGRPPVVHSGNSAPSATQNPFAASPSSGSFAATADDLSNVASISMGSRAENFSPLGVVSMSKSVSKMKSKATLGKKIKEDSSSTLPKKKM